MRLTGNLLILRATTTIQVLFTGSSEILRLRFPGKCVYRPKSWLFSLLTALWARSPVVVIFPLHAYSSMPLYFIRMRLGPHLPTHLISVSKSLPCFIPATHVRVSDVFSQFPVLSVRFSSLSRYKTKVPPMCRPSVAEQAFFPPLYSCCNIQALSKSEPRIGL